MQANMQVNISKLEQALNNCTKVTTVEANALSTPAALLTEIYGLMIYERKQVLDLDDYLQRGVFNDDHVKALEEFYVHDANA